MKISSPSSPNLIFELDPENSLVPLHCSVRGNPIPQLQWSRHDSQDIRALDAVQLPTGFNQSALSILTINITELGPGNHTFLCTATLDPFNNGTLRLSSSLAASISIKSLNDIRIIPESFTYNFNGEDDRNRFILLNCSVRAYPHEPRFEWSHSGHNLDSYTTNVTNYAKLLASGSVVYWSVLHYPLAKTMNGTNIFMCHAYAQQASLVAYSAVTVLTEGKFVHNSHLDILFLIIFPCPQLNHQ